MRVVLCLCVAGLSLVFAACASAQAPTTPSPAAAWSLTFQLSGGFAGFDRKLELTSSGAATVVDRRRNVTRTAQVSPDELKAVAAMVSTARAAEVRAPGCADCFEYGLDVHTTGGAVTIHANDAGMSDSEAAPLIRSLSQLMNKLLSEGQA